MESRASRGETAERKPTRSRACGGGGEDRRRLNYDSRRAGRKVPRCRAGNDQRRPDEDAGDGPAASVPREIGLGGESRDDDRERGSQDDGVNEF